MKRGKNKNDGFFKGKYSCKIIKRFFFVFFFFKLGRFLNVGTEDIL